MTPAEALQVLDRASSMAAMPRQDHVTVQQALAVLAALIPKQPPALPAAPDTSPCG